MTFAANLASFVSATNISSAGTPGSMALNSALPTSSGGTGLTSFATNGIPFATSTSTLATSSSLTYTSSGILQISNASGIPSYAVFAGNASSDPFYVGQDASGLARLFLNGADPITLWTNGTEKARLTGSGFLGIGTTSPSTILHVNQSVGTARVTLQASASGSPGVGVQYLGATTATNWLTGSSYNIGGAFEITPSTTAGGSTFSTPAVLVNSSGYVGIGTTAPSYGLHVVASTGNPAGFVSSVSGGGNIMSQCTNAATPGTGYMGVNAFTNNVFGVGTVSGTNFPVQFYQNGYEQGRLCRAYAKGGAGTMSFGFNVSSVSVLATGNYQMNFTNAMPDANYLALATGGDSPTTEQVLVYSTSQSNTTTAAYFWGFLSGSYTQYSVNYMLGVFR